MEAAFRQRPSMAALAPLAPACQPQNDVGIALARAAPPRQAIDNGLRQPDAVLAVVRHLQRPAVGAVARPNASRNFRVLT
jgi:hypothetical protein